MTTTAPALPRIDTLTDLKVFLSNSPHLKYPSYFFSEGAMSFFNSRTTPYIYRAIEGNSDHRYHAYMVTSERFEDDPREYNVREVTIELDGDAYRHNIDTVETFDTLAKARQRAQILAAKGL